MLYLQAALAAVAAPVRCRGRCRASWEERSSWHQRWHELQAVERYPKNWRCYKQGFIEVPILGGIKLDANAIMVLLNYGDFEGLPSFVIVHCLGWCHYESNLTKLHPRLLQWPDWNRKTKSVCRMPYFGADLGGKFLCHMLITQSH